MVSVLLHPSGERLGLARVAEGRFPADHRTMPNVGRTVTTRFVLHPRADVAGLIRELQLPYHPEWKALHTALDRELTGSVHVLKTGVPVLSDSNRRMEDPHGSYVLWESHLMNPFTSGAQEALRARGFKSGLSPEQIKTASRIVGKHYARWVAHLAKVIGRYNRAAER